ncbi:MAG: tryptophan--tRNA ligase [Gracilibacteraceae bacterium]|nr:tryptophan--tRNA ligase [Gracilibacteraceae bacterium]
MAKKIIFSGMRPTGPLHIGHLSVVQNWAARQDEYECYYAVVDWHALTTGFEDKIPLGELVRAITLDWLSVGLDPEKCAVFVQSAVKEHAELHLLFSMFTPLSWLERVPTYKDQIQQLGRDGKDLHMYGFLGYPLLQAADILTYRAEAVPVGEDQLPHIEFCREVARRFNRLYAPVFPEPQALVGKTPLLPGTDGRKMSKSYGNSIAITASAAEIEAQTRQMVTDPARVRKSDPGHPEVCVAHKFHQIYSAGRIAELEEDCRAGRVGCTACKKELAAAIDGVLAPYRDRRAYWAEGDRVGQVLAAGQARARAAAAETLEAARAAMGLSS